jgi:flagellum-specific peptidoglycan hydrolase FlgJ
MKQSVLFFLAGIVALSVKAQKNPLVEAYIEKFATIAMDEQVRTGIPAAVKLAQGIHESGAGQGDLALKSNNHFGIKCKSNWTGLTAYHDDDEKGECFRAYENVESSYKDHSDFLKTSKRYAHLFLLAPDDYKGWANGLKQAGYATNPKYPLLIIKLIETYELNAYTLLALNKSLEIETLQSNLSSEPKESWIFD